MPEEILFGGIELGGTKTVVAVGSGQGNIFDSVSLPTLAPVALMPQIAAYFAEVSHRLGPIAALGVGAFGPIVIDPRADDHGRLLQTNKPGWSGFDLAGGLQSACGLPPRIVTDVGAAGIAEARFGALIGVETGVYVTIGTGIGGAIICRGEPLAALLHPEMGHVVVERAGNDPAPSQCRFHDSCVEGLAAGPAIMARFGQSLSAFAPDSAEHRLIADYIGQFCANLVLTLSPQRIVIGGGVGKTPGLLAAVQAAMLSRLGPYAPAAVGDAAFLCAPALGENAGIIGALHLAARPRRGAAPALVQSLR